LHCSRTSKIWSCRKIASNGFFFDGQCAPFVNEIIAATTHIGMIRERATEICIGLQDLELPAFVTLTIVDEAMPANSIRMWAKWELITAVKHFRQRRERED
jgi:hypothetical protein